MRKTFTAFEAGYWAYCRNYPYDISQSQEWRNGWRHAEEIEMQVLSTG